jgi:GntR family transcriptional regulator
MGIIQTRSVADQVEEILRERIRNATYPPGSRMPSESDLSGDFGVSRATVRTVLAKLAFNGLIIRKQGTVLTSMRGFGKSVHILETYGTWSV